MENFVQIGVFLGLGLLFRRIKDFPREFAQALNFFALYVSLPALILLKVPQLSFSRELLVAAIVPWGMLLVSVVLVLLGARLWHWSRSCTAVLLLIVPLGNTSFMGVPMVQAFFGTAGIPFLIIYDQLGTLLIFASYGSFILALYGREGSMDLATVARRLFLFPPAIALVVGLALRPWTYPAELVHALQGVAASIVPLVMTAVGFQLRLRLRPGILAPLGYGMAIKLLVAPMAALLACRLLGLHGLASDVAVFEAGMPPMVTAGALAVAAGLDAELSVALVGFGIFFSFATLPLLYWLLQVFP
ncbi:MAG TPA: AEC family transporter [Desulfuromonadales bacterium]|nr:AEC family transporter [Desulfuromonadales bacterium]